MKEGLIAIHFRRAFHEHPAQIGKSIFSNFTLAKQRQSVMEDASDTGANFEYPRSLRAR